jgi:flagellar hook-basal body complex protein FliE
MTISPLGASSAYTQVAQLANRGLEAQSPAGASGFSEMLAEQFQGLVAQGNAAEASQAAAINGRADVVDVVTAVAETEIALETLVSVRDKVIAAYEEIMRMPI